jgi:hypothetical protein
MYDHMASSLNGKIILCGGFTGSSQVVTQKCSQFNNDLKVWIPIADLPVPLRDAQTVVIEPNLFFVGGWVNSPVASVYMYNSTVWTQLKDLSEPRYSNCALTTGPALLIKANFSRYSNCALAWNGKILVTGGSRERTGGSRGTIDLKTVELYDPVSGQSSPLPEMNFARRHHACERVTLQDGRTGIFSRAAHTGR